MSAYIQCNSCGGTHITRNDTIKAPLIQYQCDYCGSTWTEANNNPLPQQKSDTAVTQLPTGNTPFNPKTFNAKLGPFTIQPSTPQQQLSPTGNMIVRVLSIIMMAVMVLVFMVIQFNRKQIGDDLFAINFTLTITFLPFYWAYRLTYKKR
jgi:hypothetical protein